MAVLRSELHNVQKIMVEDIGEKKEQQLADLRTNNEKLKEELVQLKSESTSKLSSLTQKVQEVEDEKEDLKEKFYCADAQSESLKANTVISKNLKKKMCNLCGKHIHFSSIRVLCSMKCSRGALQHLLYLMYMKTSVAFVCFFFLLYIFTL